MSNNTKTVLKVLSEFDDKNKFTTKFKYLAEVDPKYKETLERDITYLNRNKQYLDDVYDTDNTFHNFLDGVLKVRTEYNTQDKTIQSAKNTLQKFIDTYKSIIKERVENL
jgi:hypothetical protein